MQKKMSLLAELMAHSPDRPEERSSSVGAQSRSIAVVRVGSDLAACADGGATGVRRGRLRPLPHRRG